MMMPASNVLRSGRLRLECGSLGLAHVMGILNVTPDSFFDGGTYLDADRACDRAARMVEEGAAIIDVGGASSRPRGKAYGEGASLVNAQEEMDRILPVVESISKSAPDTWISVDTFRSDVAREALKVGATMINDITALRFDPALASVVASKNVPLVLMHSVGLPPDMPQAHQTDNVLEDVERELREALEVARRMGCLQLVLDPGFGFGKSVKDNLTLIAHTDRLVSLGSPVLVGVSRKSTIGHVMNSNKDPLPPCERLEGSLAVTAIAVQQGASIVRTHDVLKTRRFLDALSETMQTRAGSMPYNAFSMNDSARQ